MRVSVSCRALKAGGITSSCEGPGRTLYKNWHLSLLLNDRDTLNVWDRSVMSGQSDTNAQTVFRGIDINTGHMPENNRRQGWKGDLQPAKLNARLRGPPQKAMENHHGLLNRGAVWSEQEDESGSPLLHGLWSEEIGSNMPG